MSLVLITESNVFYQPIKNLVDTLSTINSSIEVKTAFSKESKIPIITIGASARPISKSMGNVSSYNVIFTISAVHTTKKDAINLAESIKNKLNDSESNLAKYNMIVNTKASVNDAFPVERNATSRFFVAEVTVDYLCL